MFKIESYVTPILLSYVDKYVRDFKPADAQVRFDCRYHSFKGIVNM